MSDGVLRLADHRPKPDDAPVAEYRPTCLVLVPGLTFDEWVHEWHKLDQTSRSINWLLGDALLYAEKFFADKWTQVVSEKYIHAQKGALWVASRILPAERRESLSWSAHRETAGLKPSRRKKILDLAESAGWNTAKVKAEIARRYPDARQKRPEKFHVELDSEPVEGDLTRDIEVMRAAVAKADAKALVLDGSMPNTPHLELVDEVPATIDEAVDLLAHLPLGALPENIAEAISLVLSEYVLLRGVLAAAKQAVVDYDLPELAAMVGAFSEEMGLPADAE